MSGKNTGLLSLLCGVLVLAGSARAGVIVTLKAFGSNGQPISGPVAPGTSTSVDILLSVDAADAPLSDVRLIQFDFDATSPNIQLDVFTWTVDANAYSFQDAEFPLTTVVSIYLASGPGLLTLTTEPVKVGEVDITIDAAGKLDVSNPAGSDENYGAQVQATFDSTETYNYMLGNLRGGSLNFTITSSGGGGGGITPPGQDFDGDGVVDTEDAFPEDPGEAYDTNGNGVGNNADPDDDGDGVVDEDDAFPINAAETKDSDGDGVGDNEDLDRDGDNVANDGDAFPDDPSETMDTDHDGIGNNADPDDDNDGIPDVQDAFPLDPNRGGGTTDDGGTATGSRPSMCGAGMLGSSIFMLLGLGLMSFRPRRRL